MAYIGNTVENQGFTPAIDYFNGNGVTVTFTLSRPVASVAQVIVAIDNVIQNPSSSFTVAGNAITFSSAPLSGTNNIWVEYTSLITTYQGISQDPTVIGDIRATGGYLAEGDFGNSFVDGAILDYVTGNGRLTVGDLDDITFYHGGTAGRSEMMRLSYAGNSYIVGKLGVGAAPAAWPATSSAVDFGGSGISYIGFNSTGGLPYGYIYSNSYYNGTNNIYKTNSFATATGFGNTGKFQWFTAPSGTAGNTVPFTEVMTIDNTGNVGIGTSSPSTKLHVEQSTTGDAFKVARGGNYIIMGGSGSGAQYVKGFEGTVAFGNAYAGNTTFLTGDTERMRIDSSGNLWAGTTTFSSSMQSGFSVQTATNSQIWVSHANGTGTGQLYSGFFYDGGLIGSITQNGTTAVAYNTSSDYRLKENIAPMTGALAKVQQLKPCTYTWKLNGSAGQGFIAHELAEICPDAVSGEKDAVETYTDEDGNEQTRIKPQGIDTSFLVATLTAAIQELKAEIDALKASK